MSSIKAMLSVLMDGIKDANMLLDYAKNAMTEGKTQAASWFKTHAKSRIDELDGVYNFVSDEIHLDEKVRQGDEVAMVLSEYINSQLDDLDRRCSSM